MVRGFALGPYSGKETGETALMQELGVEVVTRLHQHREADSRRSHRLGTDDHLVERTKAVRIE